MQWMLKKLLIWGTTYPEFSRKYYETVCTGAVDAETGRLIRIYPITLRHLEQRFKLYSWVEAEVAANGSDFRPESHRIQQDSIRVVGQIGTKRGEWEERREWILNSGNVFSSVAKLKEAEKRDHTSLGLVKPKEVRRVYARRRTQAEQDEWVKHREDALRQRDLFVDPDSKTRELVLPGVEYRMKFVCDDPGCPGEHDMSILDWGVYVLSRKQYAVRGPVQAERDVISQIESRLDFTKRDAYLFLGNSMPHPQNFMIVGFFCPPILAEETKTSPDDKQLTLF